MTDHPAWWRRPLGRVAASSYGVLLGLVSTLVPVRPSFGGDLDQALGIVLRMNEAAAQSQKRVAKLDEQAKDLRQEYRSVQQQLASLEQYNEQIQRLVDAQNAQADDIERQISEATEVGRGVTPLMARMVEALEQFVALDVPFLLEERKERVGQLRALLDRPDVTEAEKYRIITEAYQIENEYGRTIEVYRGELATTPDAKARIVEFLRIGRVALIYRTVDQTQIGLWNPTTKAWEKLPASYASGVKKGFRIARKQAAPDLFPIPVPAPAEEEPS